ncbi:MAG TPA: RNA methyltransferase [Pyrinomonadaceae bacterium]|nr:RNA methyltransferase [Pyrinomonadaceae bacterium]
MITSRDNSLLRLARAVRDGKEDGLIFVEGLRLCEEAASSGLTIQAVIYSNEIARKERAATLLAELSKKCDRLGEVSESLLSTISYTKTPQGMIVLAERPESSKEVLWPRKSEPDLLVILDGINNPVNVGAILRSAEAAGATGVITSGNSSDPFSPKALRGAMGSAFRLPIWSGATYDEALSWCEEHKIKTVGADLSATKLHTDIDWNGPRALVVGTESTGLSPEQVRMTDEAVKIPMLGEVESLNVSVAAAILLYEANRQRSLV